MEGKEKVLSFSSPPFKLGPEASLSPQRCPFSHSERCSLLHPSSSSPFDEKEGQLLKRLKEEKEEKLIPVATEKKRGGGGGRR